MIFFPLCPLPWLLVWGFVVTWICPPFWLVVLFFVSSFYLLFFPLSLSFSVPTWCLSQQWMKVREEKATRGTWGKTQKVLLVYLVRVFKIKHLLRHNPDYWKNCTGNSNAHSGRTLNVLAGYCHSLNQQGNTLVSAIMICACVQATYKVAIQGCVVMWEHMWKVMANDRFGMFWDRNIAKSIALINWSMFRAFVAIKSSFRVPPNRARSRQEHAHENGTRSALANTCDWKCPSSHTVRRHEVY